MTATKAAADPWIGLKPPTDVFKAMIPKIVRFDEKAIGLPGAGSLSACYDGDDSRSVLSHPVGACPLDLQTAGRVAGSGDIDAALLRGQRPPDR